MAKKTLTDRFIKSRKKAPSGQRKDYPDAIVPGLALRVTDRGHKSFVLVARYPSNPDNPTRRAIGDYGAVSLDKARRKARDWLELLGKGIDPKIDEARERALQARQQTNTFAFVASEFLDRHASTLRKAAEARRVIENEFVSRWGARPVTEIQPEEVSLAIRAIVKRGASYQAHNALGYLRGLFNWAIGTHEFGLAVSPVERLKAKSLIGVRVARERTLLDDELRAVWRACDDVGYPYGPLTRLLILTGQREREIADLQWSEIDVGKKFLTIPATRMKGARAHEVPLSADALGLLESLPRFNAGGFVFSTMNGSKPVNGFSKAKVRIDRFSGVTGWVFHDLRRTMRTHLSALPVQDVVREIVIAHTKPGLHKVYDQHTYRDEKRQCLDLWAARLAGIVNPPPEAVTDLAKERQSRRRK